MAFNSVLNFHTSVRSSEALCAVLVIDDLDLNAFSSPESSPQQINSLLTSPICSDCSLWSQKKSEYLKAVSRPFVCHIAFDCNKGEGVDII